MYSKLHLIYVLLFAGILELPTVLMDSDEEVDLYDFRHIGPEVRCSLQPNGWDCFGNETVLHRFYYDIKMQSCKTHEYGGCDINFNGFTSLDDCNSLCNDGGAEAINADKMKELATGIACSLQHDSGTCFKYFPMYYYDTSTRSCKSFSYSGCGGNRNRFASTHECIDTCGTAVPEYKLVRRKKN